MIVGVIMIKKIFMTFMVTMHGDDHDDEDHGDDHD